MQFLISWKPLSLFKLIFKPTMFWQTPKFDLLQKALFLTLTPSTDLVVKAVQIEAG